MAERAVYTVLAKLADPLIRALIEESIFLYGVRDEVEWLQKELKWMQCFLIDAEGKLRRGNELIKNWLREVREVAHEAEDIIDTFTLKKKKKKKRGLLQRIKRYAAFPRDLYSLHTFGTEINGLKAKIDRIKESRERYGLVELPTETTPSAADEAIQARRKIYSHLNDTTRVVGLDVHSKEIANQLLNPKIKRRSVVSIVGIGGLGKTTLANKVFNEIKAEFDVSACISVSEDYKVFEIYKELARQMMGKTMAELQSCAMVELSEMLLNFLRQKRYLIVLDDVWKEDVWDRLIKEALPEVKNGSRVVLTTRNTELAKSIDRTIPPYELPFLDKDESWALFLNKAFPPNQEDSSSRCPKELEGIGRRLVKRCRGLPLALEVLGGILSTKEPNTAEWTSVAEHFDWGSTDDGGNCSKILGLSYDNLPHHHMKSCFLYLGVFPEDSEIEAQALIELWIAEGFIPQHETQILMEDTAHAYLEELASRSMIQVVDKDWLADSASVASFRIHDLFRDLCIREAREDGLFNIYSTRSNSTSTTLLQDTINVHGKNLRRLVVHGDISTTTSTSADLMLPRNLKSILQFGTGSDAPSSIIIRNGQLKLLRVIHLVGVDMENDEKFLEMFSNMRHLRYVRLLDYRSNIESLPPCIRNLCNLQTLHLGVSDVTVLPDWLGEIRTLRHLYSYGYVVSCLGDVGNLTNLQTLDVPIDARTGGWMELVNIRKLQVRLDGEEQWQVVIDSFRKMKYLSKLSLRLGGDVTCVDAEAIPIELFSGLSENTHLRELQLLGPIKSVWQQLPAESLHVFPPNLTTLYLSRSGLAEDPMATLEKLPYLRVLVLRNNAYIGKEMVCTSGGFPRLREFELFGLKELEKWRVEDGAMPNLCELTILCEKLKTLPGGLQHLPSLKTLRLKGYLEDGFDQKLGKIGKKSSMCNRFNFSINFCNLA